jgi:hypothetical protein
MDYKELLNKIRVTRGLFIDLVEQLTLDQINTLPSPYLNTVGWNYAHVIATQQLLTYGLHKMPFQLPQEFIDTYRKGTKTERDITSEELSIIHKYAIESLDQLELDLKAQAFTTFNSYETSFGVTLNTFQDALAFLPIHEALHLGMCMARRKNL